MKDAKGHGSDPRGAHAEGVQSVGQPATYLRVGAWHPSETSRNYALGKTENGVSVYHLDKAGKPIAPEGEWAEVDLRDRLRGPEPKFLVQGEHVGYGHDGEPLLKRLRVVGEYQK